jgi:hypothetical protein
MFPPQGRREGGAPASIPTCGGGGLEIQWGNKPKSDRELNRHYNNRVKNVIIAIVISSEARNLSFVFAVSDVTTRYLTGVYAEFNEVFEITYYIGSSRCKRKPL